MAELVNFKEVKVDLPDGRRATISAVVPITNADTIEIDPPIDRTEGASVVGFLETNDGSTISVPNFYVGDVNSVNINNRKGQNVTVVSLNAGFGTNYVKRGGA